MRSIIGITVDIGDNRFLSTPAAYMTAIERAGGVPIIIPYYDNEESIRDIVELCDGFVFSGGADISPERYGETALSVCGKPELLRDELEFRLFKEILNSKKPLLAICRGCQFLNVAFGGTLFQDIPSQISTNIQHRQAEPTFSYSHSVRIKKGTPLFELMGCEEIKANSFHHQSIKRLGDMLDISATANDGVIEGIYYTGEQYIRGYQWHPERLCTIDEYQQRIFDDLLKHCEK